MKTLRVFGWAIIFTVTLLLVACASHTPKVANTDTMSGPDAIMTQPDEQRQVLERQENAMVINQAWLNEHERKVAQKESDVASRENELAINQAWLNEHERKVAQKESDVASRENELAINQAWLNEREAVVEKTESRTTSPFKPAGADSLPVLTDSSLTKVEASRCYASVFIPAQYRTVAVTKPLEGPKGETLPTLYQTVTEQVKVSNEQMSWEEILCETDKTGSRVIEIQRALSRGGYNPGPTDGIVGQQTMAAVNAFQKDFNLTVANHLTVETVKALDANF
jgi:hypothetical protein